ncbi:DCC1-like thiol-disulfide oxidoreductase family protein [Agrobacterium burrii]|uniref:DUF393 domain-containing protein n=1 Tax=Agrobacterium burrii TaxID=2815339 RepID=A0ABS3ERT1_9HYPH|nr:DCC1-like thiol-disulfide oxidoreductase family protein [Agrobacterium burrii]MBO0134621.1 DUF393 domain-containing protein [Agrobacterium burrii]
MKYPVIHVFFDDRCDLCLRFVRPVIGQQAMHVMKAHSIWGELGKEASGLVGKEPGQSIVVFAEGRALYGLKAIAKLLWTDRRFFAAFLTSVSAWMQGDLIYELVAKYRMRLNRLSLCTIAQLDLRLEGQVGSAVDLLAETAEDHKGLAFRTLRSNVIWRSDASAKALVAELEGVSSEDCSPKLFGLPWEIGLGFCNYKPPKV